MYEYKNLLVEIYMSIEAAVHKLTYAPQDSQK